MDHVNNAVYADWLDEQVLAAGGPDDVRAIPRLVRLEYARAAEAGSSVDALTWRDAGGGWSCLVSDTAGTELLRGSPGADPAGHQRGPKLDMSLGPRMSPPAVAPARASYGLGAATSMVISERRIHPFLLLGVLGLA